MKKSYRPADFMNHKNIERAALAGGAEIEFAHGSHRKIRYKGETMTYSGHETGIGLATKIFKWMIKMGLIGSFLFIVIRINGLI